MTNEQGPRSSESHLLPLKSWVESTIWPQHLAWRYIWNTHRMLAGKPLMPYLPVEQEVFPGDELIKDLEPRLVGWHLRIPTGIELVPEMVCNVGLADGSIEELGEESGVQFISQVLSTSQFARKGLSPDEFALLEIDEYFYSPDGSPVRNNPEKADYSLMLFHKGAASHEDMDDMFRRDALFLKIGEAPPDNNNDQAMNTRYFKSFEELVDFVQVTLDNVKYNEDGADFFSRLPNTGTFVAGTDHDLSIPVE